MYTFEYYFPNICLRQQKCIYKQHSFILLVPAKWFPFLDGALLNLSSHGLYTIPLDYKLLPCGTLAETGSGDIVLPRLGSLMKFEPITVNRFV